MEEGKREGKREGKTEGQQELIQILLEERFGPLSKTTIERLQAWSDEKLREIGKGLLKGQSFKELGLED